MGSVCDVRDHVRDRVCDVRDHVRDRVRDVRDPCSGAYSFDFL